MGFVHSQMVTTVSDVIKVEYEVPVFEDWNEAHSPNSYQKVLKSLFLSRYQQTLDNSKLVYKVFWTDELIDFKGSNKELSELGRKFLFQTLKIGPVKVVPNVSVMTKYSLNLK